jgi:hypothetical protein
MMVDVLEILRVDLMESMMVVSKVDPMADMTVVQRE